MKENPIRSAPGIPVLLMLLAALVVAVFLVFIGAGNGSVPSLVGGIVLAAVAIFCLVGLYMVEPNQAAVLSLFGRYVGTVKDNGLRWNNPFYGKRKVSQRIRNFESGKLKVNELDGSPIEIAAVIVWQVVDSAEAVYNVDEYESFVRWQPATPTTSTRMANWPCAAMPRRSPSTCRRNCRIALQMRE
jgi:regulator of protease activity HflC (stomatin/prohibitin superfamily)